MGINACGVSRIDAFLRSDQNRCASKLLAAYRDGDVEEIKRIAQSSVISHLDHVVSDLVWVLLEFGPSKTQWIQYNLAIETFGFVVVVVLGLPLIKSISKILASFYFSVGFKSYFLATMIC